MTTIRMHQEAAAVQGTQSQQIHQLCGQLHNTHQRLAEQTAGLQCQQGCLNAAKLELLVSHRSSICRAMLCSILNMVVLLHLRPEARQHSWSYVWP